MDTQLTIRPVVGALAHDTLDYLAARARPHRLRARTHPRPRPSSPLNRGDFYACVGARGEVRGAALLGHATLVEAEDEEAADALARFAHTRPPPQVWSGASGASSGGSGGSTSRASTSHTKSTTSY